jgi:hypothetical protein
MFRRFSRRTWMLIGGSLVAVAVVVALALTVGGGEADDGDVATGTSTTVAPTTAPASPTTEDTATTTGGATTTAPCTDPTPDGEVLAEVDLDGDGSEEVFVRTEAGGPRDVARLFRRDGCDLVPVSVDGAPAHFPVGSSLRVSGGVRCDVSAGTVVVYSGASEDGESYDVTWRELRLEGSVLVQVGTGSGTARIGDELQTAASTFDCGR